MPGKLGISSIVYAKAFITRAWVNRATMEDYERRGFFHFLYLTACGHAETVVADYLKSILFNPTFQIARTTDFPKRKFIDNGSETLVSTEPEQRAVQRLLERAAAELERSPLDRIESLHKTISGTTIRDVIGADQHDKLKGLLSIRNLLAHGRLLYVTFEDSGTVDSTFEQHPLENAVKSLRQSGLFDPNAPVDGNDLNSLIYRDDVVLHFWNASVEIGRLYREKASRERLLSIAWVQQLEGLSP